MDKHSLSRALYRTDQTRELDRLAIEEFGTPGLTLMERAGRCAFDQIMQRFPGADRVVVMCGPGNNGGDGYVVARLMHQIGVQVVVVRTSEPKTKDATTVCQAYLKVGGSIEENASEVVACADLIVDALLGAGLTRTPSPPFASLIEDVNQNPCPCVAIDLPSGLSGDTGQAFDPTINATCTVTFIGKKLGMYTADGETVCGERIYESLDIDPEVYRHVSPAAQILAAPKFAPRKSNSHKGNYGDVVIAGGDYGMLGAVLLAGRAALRTGAGLVTVASRENHLDKPALSQPELMSDVYEQSGQCEALLSRADAIVIGPGTRKNAWGQDIFTATTQTGCARVIDAGGLRMLAATVRNKFDQQVLTPHPGEAAALLKCTSAEIQQDRVAAATAICDQFGGVCVLKGAGTIIAGNGLVRICDRGNPGMASAGMGDVLSGMIGALLAMGMAPMEAACAGVWLHAESADRAARVTSQPALLASDVIGDLGGVILERFG
ncbi:MAG: NAD(P)H-hydrate dehydratase [bacterium]